VLKSKDAHSEAHGMIATYEDKFPRLAKYLSDNIGDVMTFLAFPKSHHRKIHSTNLVERLTKRLKEEPKS